MNITLTPDQRKGLKEAGLDHPTIPTSGYGESLVPIEFLEDDYLTKLTEWAKKDSKTNNGILQRLSMWDNARKNCDTIAPKVLSQLEAVIHAAMLQLPNRMVFTTGEVQEPMLYLHTNYSPRDKDTPASVISKFAYYTCGAQRTHTVTFYQDHMTGNDKTIMELFLTCRVPLTRETPELMQQYTDRLIDYSAKRDQLQSQFLYTTDRLPSVISDRYSSEKKYERVGTSTYRVVNDDDTAKIDNSPVLRLSGRDKRDPDSATIHHLPIWPRIMCFNLEIHDNMWLEPWKMTPYVYDHELVNRLIVPDEHKELLRLLVENPDTLVADFVAGKSGGTFIICWGEPGLGKSLAAEAFSEGTERILYRIRADQLGMTPKAIEEAFQKIFARAERWNAVILLDEADIYIRKRGYDMNQNAIVGTMLQMLEYTQSTLFATTNLGSDVDDAIVSRAHAVLGFDYPDLESSMIIARQFSKLFGLTVSDFILEGWLAPNGTLNSLSGRTIKNILRLTARRGLTAPTTADLISTSRYVFDRHQTKP